MDERVWPRVVTQLGYVGFGAIDLDAWRTFGPDVLGVAIDPSSTEESLHLRFDDHACRVFVDHDPAEDLIYAGWQVAGPEQFAAARRHVEGQGVTIGDAEADGARAAHRLVQGLFSFEDPDGLRCEVYWGPHVRSAPFVPGRPIGGFVTGAMGVGHIVTAVEDRQRSEDFYAAVLGLTVADYGSGPLVFMRCNARHHSAAFIDRALHPLPKRLVHLMLEVAELDDVGTAFDLCLHGAAPIAQVLGRHSNDLSFSFYVTTPSGFDIEYGWGPRTTDDATWTTNRYLDRDVWGHQTADDQLALLKKITRSRRTGP